MNRYAMFFVFSACTAGAVESPGIEGSATAETAVEQPYELASVYALAGEWPSDGVAVELEFRDWDSLQESCGFLSPVLGCHFAAKGKDGRSVIRLVDTDVCGDIEYVIDDLEAHHNATEVLVHEALHSVGYVHGAEMDARIAELTPLVAELLCGEVVL